MAKKSFENTFILQLIIVEGDWYFVALMFRLLHAARYLHVSDENHFRKIFPLCIQTDKLLIFEPFFFLTNVYSWVEKGNVKIIKNWSDNSTYFPGSLLMWVITRWEFMSNTLTS